MGIKPITVDSKELYMKKVIILIGVVLVAALMLASCQIEYGGTIKVKNNYKILGVAVPIDVTVIQGTDTTNDNKKTIEVGKTATWHFEKDGVYTVGCVIPPYVKPVTLLGGNTVELTIGED
jgi:hypothetical protein